MSIGPGADSPEGEPVPEFDADDFTEPELVTLLGAADAIEARNHAKRLLWIARLARRRRRTGELGTADGRGRPGLDARATADAVLAEVAEEFVAELALTRGCSEPEAAAVLREAILATTVLAPAWRALDAGRIGPRHLRVLVDLLGDAPAEIAEQVQARVLPRADGTPAHVFRDRIRYHLYRVDAAARDRRRREALRRVGVFTRRVDEGVSELVIQGPTPAVHAAANAIDQYAWLRRADGDLRPIGVIRADTALDLLLRPWDTSRPPVTATLVLHASVRSLRPDGDPAQTSTPGELDGQLVSAAECRDLLTELDLLHLGDPPPGGSILVAVDDPTTGQTLAVATRTELARAAGAGRRRRRRRRAGPGQSARPPEPADPPTDGPGLHPPPDTAAYQPTAAQKRLVTTRDRHCRMPGCRRRVGRCDLDHVRPHDAGGPTACWNLCCLCKTHHRIKTFAPGWAFTLLRDGTLLVRTPAGVTRTTRPPGWHPDPEPDPPWLDEQAPADLLRQ
jgi:hypothetical protein